MSKADVWKTWESRVVDGKFPLRKWLGGSDYSAVFLTERPGQSAQRAAIKLVKTDSTEANRQVSRLRATAGLSHPHLIRTFEAGHGQMDGEPFVYVVMEYAEENLSEILPLRALAASEVSELLPPLLDAISYLHERGLIHGHIRPSNVMAVNDQLKLSTDQVSAIAERTSIRRRGDVYEAPEISGGTASQASDIWSIGATIVAALSQNASLEGTKSDVNLREGIPEPFRTIASECLRLDPKQRCTLAEIQARLRPMARPVESSTIPEVTKRRPIFPIAAILALILVVFGIIYVRGRKSSVEGTGQTEATTQSAPAQNAAPATPAPEAKKPSPSSAGAVTHQVLPDVSQSAKNTIRGTIKVSVRVDVDSSGKVTEAKLQSAGPSRYFADKALKAAQQWQFSPPQAGGQPVASAWLVQFRFRRSAIQALPERLGR